MILKLSKYTACMGAFLWLVACSADTYAPSGFDTSEIQIVRDDFGVPHIFAPTDVEVVYGLAWAHAEDDFETIQKTLLAGKGMVGRVFGEEGAAIDFFVHLLETREIAAAQFEDFSPQFRSMMEAYAAGMNDFALAYPERVLLRDAFPVSTQDITSAYILSLAQMSGADQAVKAIVEETIDQAIEQTPNQGSNAIAIHPTRTDTGEAFLAINSHQPLEGPVAWYEAHLQSEEGWNIIGGLFPGGMTIFHGVNEHLGWAHTVNRPDKLDVFQLKMHPEKDLFYEVDGEWLELEERRVWLKVKLWDMITVPVPKKVWKSIYGPTLINSQGAYSIKTGALEEIRAPEQWYHMNKAKSYTEFKKAMDMMALTGFNTVYADRYDTIYFVSNALLPIRNEAYDYTGVLLGDKKDKLWDSYYPFDSLPQQLNPLSGYLYNTNHSLFKASGLADNLHPTDYPKSMDYLLSDNNRSLRFRELMSDTTRLSYEDFKRIKFDKQLPDSLAFKVDVQTLFELEVSKYPDISQQIETLKHWDKNASTDSKGAALFAYVYYFQRDSLEIQDAKLKEEQAIQALTSAKRHFEIYFDNELVDLGTYQKLVRGKKELPLFGLEDVLSAMRSEPHQAGMRKGVQGESYIMMVRFGAGLPVIETINAYGASNQPNSPHYADQMELFVQQKLKPMTLDKDSVLKYAKRVYEPRK